MGRHVGRTDGEWAWLWRCVGGLVMGGCLTASGMAAETVLPAQAITFGGTVTAPACTVTLDTDRLRFTRAPGDRWSADDDVAGQTLRLRISRCEADSVGVAFTAAHWPDNPVRGTLTGITHRRQATDEYYTLGPGDGETALQREADSPAPGGDPRQGGVSSAVYYSLAGVTYWYELAPPITVDAVRVLPFRVSMHAGVSSRERGEDETRAANFTLQVSWR